MMDRTKHYSHKDFHEIGQKSWQKLNSIGISAEQSFLEHTPEEIYDLLLIAVREGRIDGVNRNFLYALRANRHYLETSQRLPLTVFEDSKIENND